MVDVVYAISALGIAISFCLNLAPIPSLITANKTKDLKEISHYYFLIANLNYVI